MKQITLFKMVMNFDLKFDTKIFPEAFPGALYQVFQFDLESSLLF